MLVFLKLGGSLITDKSRPYTANLEALRDLAAQIKRALDENPELHIVLGHGSGSFGHESGKRFGTREGVHTPGDWMGFAQVWHDARALNNIVLQELISAGLPALSFSPSATSLSEDKTVTEMQLNPLRSALEHKLLPVVHGDVAFDTQRGGTIVSTEDVFAYMANNLQPERILIAGAEEGVWQDYSAKTGFITQITPLNYQQIANYLTGSQAKDVTGGMKAKVELLKLMLESSSATDALIFSGFAPCAVYDALSGKTPGTQLTGFRRFE